MKSARMWIETPKHTRVQHKMLSSLPTTSNWWCLVYRPWITFMNRFELRKWAMRTREAWMPLVHPCTLQTARTSSTFLPSVWWGTNHKTWYGHECLFARAKAGFRISGKELQLLHLQGIMFRWGIDFVGPLPETKRGKKCIDVCIEHTIKWVELIALPTKSSANVGRAFLENILSKKNCWSCFNWSKFSVWRWISNTFEQSANNALNDIQVKPASWWLSGAESTNIEAKFAKRFTKPNLGIVLGLHSSMHVYGIQKYKTKSTSYSPYFLLYAHQPHIPLQFNMLMSKISIMTLTNSKTSFGVGSSRCGVSSCATCYGKPCHCSTTWQIEISTCERRWLCPT